MNAKTKKPAKPVANIPQRGYCNPPDTNVAEKQPKKMRVPRGTAHALRRAAAREAAERDQA